MKSLYLSLLFLCSCWLLQRNLCHAEIEVQRLPELDVVDIIHDMTIILRFRFLAEDLSNIVIRYRVNNGTRRFPTAQLEDISPDNLFSVAIKDCELATEEQRQCMEMKVQILGRPSIHANTFLPDLTDHSQPNRVNTIETDRSFRMNYLGNTMTSPTSFSTTMQETVKTTVPIPTTSHPASTEQERPTKATTTSDKHTATSTDQQISTTYYVLFTVLFSLALALAVSLFTNIIVCFKLKRQKLELAQTQSNELARV